MSGIIEYSDIRSLHQPGFENRLREKRQAAGLSQKQLADMAGITRQAVAAVETNQYSPATSVALQLARALHCRVEDLFSIKQGGEIIEGEMIGAIPNDSLPARAQVTQIGHRIQVRPLQGLGELANLSVTADGLIVESSADNRRVKVKLLKDRDEVLRKIVVGGCDPAMFLAGEHLRKYDEGNVVPCLMGSSLALAALKRGEVHAAGIHLAEEVSDAWKLPDLRKFVGDMDFIVVTFAHWEEGFIVRQGNPKKIRAVADIAKPTVKIVNREPGSGARRLLDKQLRTAGIEPRRIKGYREEAFSHLDVASRVKAGLADTGISVRSVASICGLDFVPLQRERYDLIIPKDYYETVGGLRTLLDIIVSKPFRDELEALGGYDTRETGNMVVNT
ncbi:MAG TPA: substrate-binding domain-containing protein [Candidatus Limnocylindria bacterium]|nr:substrate-binding domain-containing protein [Candidatus Limnocylindria bacterium]